MPPIPPVSGQRLIRVLEGIGYEQVRQRGSHVRLRHPGGGQRGPTTVPLHRELNPGTLRSILADAGVTPEAFLEMLRS